MAHFLKKKKITTVGRVQTTEGDFQYKNSTMEIGQKLIRCKR